jgi:hypothetical protein
LGGSTGLEIVYIYCTYLYHCIILHSQWVVDLITRILGRLLNAQSVLTFQKKKIVSVAPHLEQKGHERKSTPQETRVVQRRTSQHCTWLHKCLHSSSLSLHMLSVPCKLRANNAEGHLGTLVILNIYKQYRFLDRIWKGASRSKTWGRHSAATGCILVEYHVPGNRSTPD